MATRVLLALAAACLVPVASPVSRPPVVALVTATPLPAPARHGIDAVRAALAARGFRVVDRGSGSPADMYVRVAIDPAIGCPESLSIARSTIDGRPAIELRGADATGAMYAALDTADRIAATDGPDPFAAVRQVSEQPFLRERGVSMYTMQRALFEQKLYDEAYWRKYFDLLAASRINTFVVIFGYENGGFMAPPYPYFYDTPEFPGVRLVGLTAGQQAHNTAAFKAMIRAAHERGIKVTAAIWDHIYRAGVQAGGIQGAAKGDAPTANLVWGLTGDNLAAYSKAALKKFLTAFPEVDGLQLRMHDESGLKPEEMNGFWHEVFAQIKATRPDLKIDLRAKGLPDAVIDDALAQGLDARVSTKFWMEQMGLPFHPTHVNPQDQRNRRHGYADLLRYPQRYRVHWQLWTGGTARLLLWGDPDYVRRFASAAKLYGGDSFDVNEMLATKMLGEPHEAAPIAILNAPYRYYEYEFERYWHFYQLWGRLTYAPDTPSDLWDREFARRFGPGDGPHVEAALHRASQVLPRIVAAGYRYANFPTTRGWAEMQRQGALPAFAGLEGSDTEQFMTPAAYAKNLIEGRAASKRHPDETAAWFAETAGAIDTELAAVTAGGGNRSPELASTVTDCRILSALARYYAARLMAAGSYDIFKQNGSLAAFDAAVSDERRAIDAWAAIVSAAGDVYATSLPFGARAYFPRHWREELDRLKTDLATLIASRPAHEPSGARMPEAPMDTALPAVTMDPVRAAEAGRDLAVTVHVSGVPVRSVTLRYRHLTQFEDYQSIAMTSTAAQPGVFSTKIPGSFVTRDWDVMYFVEVITTDGGGRNYPDFEKDTPYVIVPVRR